MDNLKFKFDVNGLKYPKECMESFASRIEKETRGYVVGNVKEYEGSIYSEYDKSNTFHETINSFGKGKIIKNVQDDLGEVAGDRMIKLEFYLTAPKLSDYKCRLMFAEYGLGGYPVTVVLARSIAIEIGDNVESGYVFKCENMDEFKELILSISNTEYVHTVIQNIITESLIREQMKVN